MVVTLVAHDVLRDWPKSLPENTRKPLEEARNKWRDLMTALLDHKITSEQFDGELTSLYAEWEKVKGQSALFKTVIRMSLFRPNTASSEIDFKRIVNSQAYVMVFAHLDAFMADSIRAVCKLRPEVMKCDKTMEWVDIISCGTWDRLLTQLSEQYSFQFGWQSLVKRIDFLRSQIGLKLTFPEEKLKVIDDAENIRNVLVHNGGNASQEFLDRSKRSDLALGEQVPVTLESVRTLVGTISELGDRLYEAIAEKFYGKQNPEWY